MQLWTGHKHTKKKKSISSILKSSPKALRFFLFLFLLNALQIFLCHGINNNKKKNQQHRYSSVKIIK